MTGVIHTYKTYNFVNKDPIIDEMHSTLERTGSSYADAATGSSVSVSTIRNWFHGKTRRPQNASIEAFLRALGYKREIVKMARLEDPTKKLANVKAFALPHKKDD